MSLPTLRIVIRPQVLTEDQKAQLEPLQQVAREAKSAHENAVAVVERGRAESKRLLQVHNSPSATPEEKAAARSERERVERQVRSDETLERRALELSRRANATASCALRAANAQREKELAAMRLQTRAELVAGIGAGTVASSYKGDTE